MGLLQNHRFMGNGRNSGSLSGIQHPPLASLMPAYQTLDPSITPPFPISVGDQGVPGCRGAALVDLNIAVLSSLDPTCHRPAPSTHQTCRAPGTLDPSHQRGDRWSAVEGRTDTCIECFSEQETCHFFRNSPVTVSCKLSADQKLGCFVSYHRIYTDRP